MINKEIIEEFMTTLEQFSVHEISILDTKGNLIFSTDHERTYYAKLDFQEIHLHEGDVYEFEENQQDGILNAVFLHGNVYVYIVVIGVLKEIRPISGVLRMAMEIRLKYDENLTKELETRSINEEIIYEFMHYDDTKAPIIKDLYKKGNYQLGLARRAIMIEPQLECNLETLKNTNFYYDSYEDISALYENRLYILKDCSKITNKNEKDEYIRNYLQYIKTNTILQGTAFVSTSKQNFKECKESIYQLQWLSDHVEKFHKKTLGNYYFLKDYIDEYMMSKIPYSVYANLFEPYLQIANFDIPEFMEVFEVIIANNYNLAQSSKDLFMHKNTLIYKIEKIKKQFDIDPINVEADRFFLKSLYSYILLYKGGGDSDEK